MVRKKGLFEKTLVEPQGGNRSSEDSLRSLPRGWRPSLKW